MKKSGDCFLCRIESSKRRAYQCAHNIHSAETLVPQDEPLELGSDVLALLTAVQV